MLLSSIKYVFLSCESVDTVFCSRNECDCDIFNFSICETVLSISAVSGNDDISEEVLCISSDCTSDTGKFFEIGNKGAKGSKITSLFKYVIPYKKCRLFVIYIVLLYIYSALCDSFKNNFVHFLTSACNKFSEMPK